MNNQKFSSDQFVPLDIQDGGVCWITGLSGAGKTTLANEVVQRLRLIGIHAILLDGDELREVFGSVAINGGNYDKAARLELAMRYARMCMILSKQGAFVVIATISLFKEVHAWNREYLPNYTEVYLKVPIEELRRRDPKEIYKRYDCGELYNVAGLDLDFDEPMNADLVLEYMPEKSPANLAEQLIKIL